MLFLLRDPETEPHREEVHVTMEAEVRVMELQGEKRHGPPVTPDAGDRHGIGSPSELLAATDTLISDLRPLEL